MHMPKAILILVGFVAIGVAVLHLRQQSIDLRYQTAKIHREIQQSQGELWRQQVRIAEFTSPKVIAPPPLEAKSASDREVAGARE